MAGVKKFFIDNSSQIWTLVSVIIGGLVTYLSTSAAERRKDKRRAQRENLEQILVPYCTCLEKTIEGIYTVYRDPIKLYADSSFAEWIGTLKKPLEYLKPAKRIFLSQTIREKLQKYKKFIENFEDKLEQECTGCTNNYKHYISSRLEHFPNIQSPMLITFNTDKAFEIKTKIAILNKSSITLLNNFTCIDFVVNDDPDNYRNTAVYINEGIRATWGAIKFGAMDISDVESHEIKLACILLDYIDENITDEKDVLDRIIDSTHCAEYLMEILDILNDMVKDLLKTIDKITN